jgi:hypothetical protein
MTSESTATLPPWINRCNEAMIPFSELLKKGAALGRENHGSVMGLHFEDSDWHEMEWHIKEIHHLNFLPQSRGGEYVNRLLRKQGSINRLQIRACEKMLECIRFIHLRSGGTLGDKWLNAHSRDAAAALERARDLNHFNTPYKGILKRWKRSQNDYNRAINLFLMACKCMLEKFPESSPFQPKQTPEWHHLEWHILEAGRTIEREYGSTPFLQRMRTPQKEINRLHYMSLHYLVELLKKNLSD